MRWQVRCFEPWDHVAYLYVQMLKHCLLCRSAFKQVIPFLDYTSQAALLTGTCKLLVTSPVKQCLIILSHLLQWTVFRSYSPAIGGL